MSDILKSLHEKRSKALDEARGMLKAADSEEREFSAEEEGKYDSIMQDVAKIDARSKELAEAEGRSKDLEASYRSYGVKAETPEKDGLEEFLRGRGGKAYDVHLRDLSKLTAGAGGNLVGGNFVPRLYQHMIESSALLKAGPTILRTSTGEQMTIPKTTSFSSAAQIAEGGPIVESDPVFGQLVLDAYKYGLGIQVSHELINDTAFDLQDFLSMQAGRAVGNALGADLVVGTGTNEPNGIVPAATVGKTGATAGGLITAEDLIDLQYSVIAPYRDRGSWLMKDQTLGAIRKLRENGATGGFLWQPSLQVGVPDTLLGRPIYTDPNIAGVAGSAKSVVFGDISAYYVRLVEAIRFERSDHFAFMNDLVTYRCLVRADGDLADTSGAVKVFQGAA